MEDALILIAEHLLSNPTDPLSLLAFVKLQATHRSVWLHYRHDNDLWKRLNSALPRWSLPEHMGLRRRAITGIKLLHGKCIACDGKATRVFMAFQARICGRCCCRLLISDAELAWRYGLPDPPGNPPYIVRYLGHTRVRFFMRQHLAGVKKLKQKPLTRERLLDCMRRWPGVGSREVCGLLDRMA
jgi:hypothetical protein